MPPPNTGPFVLARRRDTSKTRASALLAALVVILFAVPTIGAGQSGTAATSVIAGSVKSADGTAMEGVGVSARHRDKTYTTTVYTDRSGNYAFPPLEAGQYRLWAQTVGFEIGHSRHPMFQAGG